MYFLQSAIILMMVCLCLPFLLFLAMALSPNPERSSHAVNVCANFILFNMKIIRVYV